MTYQSAGEVSTVHDRASREAGAGHAVLELQRGRLGPASDKLSELARNRATLAIFKVAQRQSNWDGFGSNAANRESISRAATIVGALIRQVNAVGLGWVDPHVGLNETGDVSFEWWRGERKLTLYVRPEATEYVSSWGPNIETQMNAGCLVKGQFEELWRWLRTPGG